MSKMQLAMAIAGGGLLALGLVLTALRRTVRPPQPQLDLAPVSSQWLTRLKGHEDEWAA